MAIFILDPNSPGTLCIFPVVCKLLEVDTRFQKDNYFPESSDTAIRADLNAFRWKAIVKKLDSLLPQLAAEQPEAALKKLEKKKTETLLEFANRFGVAASRYTEAQLPSQVQAKLLYSKLPKELQKQLAILNFEE